VRDVRAVGVRGRGDDGTEPLVDCAPARQGLGGRLENVRDAARRVAALVNEASDEHVRDGKGARKNRRRWEDV